MTTLTLIAMLGSATVAGGTIGASAALWYRRRHEPPEIARLMQRLVDEHAKYRDLHWDYTLLQIQRNMSDREIAGLRSHWRGIAVDRRKE